MKTWKLLNFSWSILPKEAVFFWGGTALLDQTLELPQRCEQDFLPSNLAARFRTYNIPTQNQKNEGVPPPGRRGGSIWRLTVLVSISGHNKRNAKSQYCSCKNCCISNLRKPSPGSPSHHSLWFKIVVPPPEFPKPTSHACVLPFAPRVPDSISGLR